MRLTHGFLIASIAPSSLFAAPLNVTNPIALLNNDDRESSKNGQGIGLGTVAGVALTGALIYGGYQYKKRLDREHASDDEQSDSDGKQSDSDVKQSDSDGFTPEPVKPPVDQYPRDEQLLQEQTANIHNVNPVPHGDSGKVKKNEAVFVHDLLDPSELKTERHTITAEYLEKNYVDLIATQSDSFGKIAKLCNNNNEVTVNVAIRANGNLDDRNTAKLKTLIVSQCQVNLFIVGLKKKHGKILTYKEIFTALNLLPVDKVVQSITLVGIIKKELSDSSKDLFDKIQTHTQSLEIIGGFNYKIAADIVHHLSENNALSAFSYTEHHAFNVGYITHHTENNYNIFNKYCVPLKQGSVTKEDKILRVKLQRNT